MDPVIDSVVYVISADSGSWLSEAAGVLAALATTFSVLVAIIALRHSQNQIMLQKQHNILMVTPHLATTSDAIFHPNSFSFRITNNGIGPAIIKKITTYAYGKTYEVDTIKAMEDSNVMILEQDDILYDAGCYSIDEFVPPGNSQTIFSAEGFKKDPTKIRNDYFRNIRILIEYECIYKTQYIYDSDNHHQHIQESIS